MAVTLVRVVRNRGGTKKFTAVFAMGNGRTKRVGFGARGYEDYTTHHDKKRRERYRMRHRRDLVTKDPTRAGFLSWYLLWGESTDLDTNIRAFRRLLK